MRNTIQIRGTHTAIRGRITPFHVNVGSPGRALNAAKLLLEPIVLNGNRTAAVLGHYDHETSNGKRIAIPVCVYATGMGMGSTDILVREILKHSSVAQKYNGFFTGGRIVEIRAGTAGGCNTFELDAPVLKIYDIVSGEKAIGTSGAIMQAMGFMPFIPAGKAQWEDYRKMMTGFRNAWKELGGGMTKGGLLEVQSSPIVAGAIMSAAEGLGLTCYTGTVLSKESLYAEGSENLFVHLRKTENLLASEMEQLQAGYLALLAKKNHGIEVLTGVVSGIVGALPGEGFAKTEKLRREVEETVGENVVKVALGAIGIISEKLQELRKLI